MMSLVEPSVRPDWTKKSISSHFFDFLTVPVFKIKHSPINLRFQNKLTQNLKKKMTLDQKKKSLMRNLLIQHVQFVVEMVVCVVHYSIISLIVY